MQKKTFAIAGLALVLTAGAAFAQNNTTAANPPPPPPRHAPPQGGPDGGFGPGFGRGEFRRGEFGRGRFGHRPYATREELQKRQADAFARMDANKDGRVTFEEFRADLERRKLERERQMFRRFSGGQDSVTLDQLKAREAQRFEGRGGRRGDRGDRGGPDGRRGPPPAPGAAAPAR